MMKGSDYMEKLNLSFAELLEIRTALSIALKREQKNMGEDYIQAQIYKKLKEKIEKTIDNFNN